MTGLMIATAVVAVASGVYSYMAASGQRANRDEMAPANIDAFKPTTCEEGATVPLVIGTARVSANILHYGSLRSVPEYEKVGGGGKGGGGGGSQKVLQGYHYYLDLWQAICRGPVEVLRVYRNDAPQEWEDFFDENDITFNDGTGDFYPADAGPFATKLPGIAHIWLKQFSMGFNTTNTPTLHFVVRDKINTPVAHENLPNGKNPAAALYVLLLEAGVDGSMIDLESFNAAATFWNDKGYGINMSLSKRQDLEEVAKKILGWVGGYLFEDASGTWRLKALDPEAESKATITDADVFSTSFTRKSWDDTPNVFSAKFTDSTLDYTTRTVLARNPASVALLGRERSTSVDLTCFQDAATANARLWEIMKRESYPSASLEITTGLRFANLEEGDIVTVSLEEYGVTGMECAIEKKSLASIDKGEVTFSLVQVPERIFDDYYTNPGGGGTWERPDYTPVPLTHTRLFELPRTEETGSTPGLLILAARESLREDGLIVYHSNTGTDYTPLRGIYTWSQYGTLVAEYPDSTYKLDDSVGITYRPYREDPEFNSLSRADFFDSARYAIIGDEIMRFQAVTLHEDGSISLSGVERGVFHTPIQAHADGAAIWLSSIGDAVLTGEKAKRGCYKLVPSTSGRTPALSAIDALEADEVDKALAPWPVGRIKAVRTGTSVALSWWPCDVGLNGAGVAPEDVQTDQWPPAFSGDFLVNDAAVSACEHNLTMTGAGTVTVKARQSGWVSEARTITIPSEDGTYYA